MGKSLASVFVGFVALALATSAVAHHSFAAIFDPSQELVVDGTLTKVDWINPHFYCYVTDKNADGTTTDWAFEGFPPSMLKSLGLSRDQMVGNIGKRVKVHYNPALKKGDPLGYGREYDFDGGPRIVFTQPST
jgi:hypothetical protein